MSTHLKSSALVGGWARVAGKFLPPLCLLVPDADAAAGDPRVPKPARSTARSALLVLTLAFSAFTAVVSPEFALVENYGQALDV
jgi:hypothetical protein